MSKVQQLRQLRASRKTAPGNLTKAAPLNRISACRARRYDIRYKDGRIVSTKLIPPMTEQKFGNAVFGLSTPRHHLNASQRRVSALAG